MPSGFIILSDGRCFARRWSFYDCAVQCVINELNNTPIERELAEWLSSLLPKPEDEQEISIGAWVRKSDNEVIMRYLDVRELTPQNQRLFSEAARRSLSRLHSYAESTDRTFKITCMSVLVDMIERAEKGEPPLSMSDWVKVEPPSGKHSGPGW